MPLTLQSPAAAQGLTAALVSAFLKAFPILWLYHSLLLFVRSLQPRQDWSCTGLRFWWASSWASSSAKCLRRWSWLGNFLSLHLRQRAAGFCNALSIRSRGGWVTRPFWARSNFCVEILPTFQFGCWLWKSRWLLGLLIELLLLPLWWLTTLAAWELLLRCLTCLKVPRRRRRLNCLSQWWALLSNLSLWLKQIVFN